MKIWYPPDVSQRMAETLLAQGKGAYFIFTPRITEKGTLDVLWHVQGGASAQDGGDDPPGGDDSHVCPPNFPPGQSTC